MTRSAAASSTDRTLPPNAGDIASAAIFMPGTSTSMPNIARPFTLSGVSSRLARVPMSLKSFGSFNGTLAAAGTGSDAAASTSDP